MGRLLLFSVNVPFKKQTLNDCHFFPNHPVTGFPAMATIPKISCP
ncbi:hypothetical protein TPY_2341 [Sulfobacillus acidophilus TPY]|nr:hypothetical protein TPY_2341 [Sulfobacillus acidophilus TPY]